MHVSHNNATYVRSSTTWFTSSLASHCTIEDNHWYYKWIYVDDDDDILLQNKHLREIDANMYEEKHTQRIN